jgi:15-cis-phytoene synthase
MEFNTDLTACAELVQRADPDRFMATMAAPVAARLVLFPLYALNVEVARAPWVTEESMIAEMRLQWWRDAVAEIAQGDVVRRHQVVTPLAGILKPELAALMDEMIAVRRWDIYRDPFEDIEHFQKYLDRSSGTLMWVAARTLGDANEQTVRDFGFATGVANWFQAIPELVERKRIPLLDGTSDGVRALAQEALLRLNKARRSRALVSKSARPAMLAGWQTKAVLQQVIRDPDRVANGALGQSEAAKRASLLFKSTTGLW